MNLTRDNVLWFAGLYEGEGSLIKRRSSWVMDKGRAIAQASSAARWADPVWHAKWKTARHGRG